MASTKRPRALRREKARALQRLGRSLDRAALGLPGGAADHPLGVPTAAVAEAKAREQRCARCDGEVDLADEAVEFHAGAQLRRFEMVCRRCHTRRTIWIAVSPIAN